ncbi:MAG: hypothetical protein CMJ64_14260 [Planctomycetaceae bacterium]|nr:hypothetical protein [Planctomycetaceae bacterium]
MGRFLIFVYGVVSYAIGLGGLVFFMLFIGGWDFLPFHIDSGTPGPTGTALLINVGLIVAFGLQHTPMARPAFKKGWTTVIPKAAERSTYVLVSGILMFAICFYWQTLSGTIWHYEHSTLRIATTTVQLLGWGMAVLASFLINHFELFGLQQVYFNLINKPEPSSDYTERFLYKIVRHPLQLGLLIGMWSTPTMTMTHLMLSATMTIYIFIGLHFEEKDLVATLGEDYEEYRKRVRMLIPFPK